MDQNERNRVDQFIDFSSGFKQLKCLICGLSRKSFRSDDLRAIRSNIFKCEAASRRTKMILPKQPIFDGNAKLRNNFDFTNNFNKSVKGFDGNVDPLEFWINNSENILMRMFDDYESHL